MLWSLMTNLDRNVLYGVSVILVFSSAGLWSVVAGMAAKLRERHPCHGKGPCSCSQSAVVVVANGLRKAADQLERNGY